MTVISRSHEPPGMLDQGLEPVLFRGSGSRKGLEFTARVWDVGARQACKCSNPTDIHRTMLHAP